MLKRLRIKNFQSHKDSEIIFSPGVNVITGESDHGKSAILKALRLLWENRPLGFRFHSNFAKKGEATEIEIEVDSGEILKQVKDGVDTVYTIEGTDFSSKTGRDVPDFVANILNLADINIQSQLDSHFLITSPAGEVGREINQITRLEEADEWTSQATTNINSLNKENSVLDRQLKGYLTELDEYKNVDIIDKLVQEVKEGFASYDKLDEQLYSLEKLQGSLETSFTRVDELDKFLKVERQVVELEKLSEIYKISDSLLHQLGEKNNRFNQYTDEIEEFGKVLGIDTQVNSAFGCIEEIKVLDRKIKLFTQYIEVSDRIVLDGNIIESEQAIEDIVILSEEYHEMARTVRLLDKMFKTFYKDEEAYYDSEVEYIVSASEYGKVLEEFGRCPTCFSKIGSEEVKQIIEGL